MTTLLRASDSLIAFVNSAIGRESASVIEMLRHVRDLFDGFGCVLWETAPHTRLDVEPPVGSLFVLAESFRGDASFAVHDLPLEGTATGDAVRLHKAFSVPNVRVDGGVSRSHAFVLKHNLGPMMSAPLAFLDGSKGALNIYRRAGQPGFTFEDIELLGSLAAIIPSVYHAILDRVSLELLQAVDETIRRSETTGIMSSEEMQPRFGEICRQVAATFHCQEVSVFMEDPGERAGWYELQATTWPVEFDRKAYNADAHQGVTGWVLEHKRSVKLFDLRDYAEDGDVRRRDGDYPNLIWRRSAVFLQRIDELLGSDEQRSSPFSFMASPILIGGKVLGVIRCCLPRMSPYFYSGRELQLLELVAAQLGQCWSSWLDRRALRQETRSWRSVVTSTNRLNSIFQTHLAVEHFDEQLMLKEALDQVERNVEIAEGLDVRLLDAEQGELYVAMTRGRLWGTIYSRGIANEQSLRIAISPSECTESIGARVVRDAKVCVSGDLQGGEYFDFARVLPDARQIICAPIIVGNDVFGVLDVIATGDQKFPRYVIDFVTLLGQQLGLYLHLSRSVVRIRSQEVAATEQAGKLGRVQSELRRTFEDLSHQLKGPLRVASRRADDLLSKVSRGIADMGVRELATIRGLIRKAERVSKSLHLLGELESGVNLSVTKERLNGPELIRILEEAAHDTETYLPSRNLRFAVDAASFDRALSRQTIVVDRDLFEQAVNNLYDNAAKYSFDNTEIRVFGDFTGDGRFALSVANRGLDLRAAHVSECTKRGWRSDEAMWTTGEGSGIGLWVVDHIMRVHGGELVVVPTSENNLTIFKLLFPVK